MPAMLLPLLAEERASRPWGAPTKPTAIATPLVGAGHARDARAPSGRRKSIAPMGRSYEGQTPSAGMIRRAALAAPSFRNPAPVTGGVLPSTP